MSSPDVASPPVAGTGAPARLQPGATLPLTEAQEGLWFAQRIDPANPIFNTGQVVDVRGTFDVPAFARAVDAAMREAEALAMRIADSPGGPVQTFDPAQRAALEVVDLRHSADPAAEAAVAIGRDMSTPLDLARDRLAAEKVFVLGANRYRWYQRVHHVVIDGYGMALLTRRICELYAAETGGGAAGAPLGPYAAVAAQDAEYRRSANRDLDRTFWQQALAGAGDVTGLAPGMAVTAHTCTRFAARLPPLFEPAMQALAKAAAVPWPDLLAALVAAYACRHAGGEVVAGVPTMNRLGTPAARVPAMVMNVLPLHVVIDEDAPLVEFVRAVSSQLRTLRRHGRYRSEQLRRDLGLVGGQRRLYGLLVNVLPFERAPMIPGAEASLETLGTGPVDDLTVTLRAEADGHGLTLELEGNPRLYTPAQLSAHAVRLQAFLAAAVGAARLAEVPTATAAETHRWIHDVNATDHPVPDVTLTALLESSMRRAPEATALVSDVESLTYGDVDRRTAAVANGLAAAGVQSGDIVAVALPRSIDLVIALVAILRRGAAYLPLDLSQPAERTSRMLRSAQPRLVVTCAPLRPLLPAAAGAILLEELSTAAAEPPAAARAQVQPGDAAYVIYTSGSTGEPKGAVIEHRAIVNRLEWMREHYRFTAADRFLQKTPATFDVSVWEFFLPLVAGATLVVAAADAHKDPAWLARLIRAHAVTTVHFVPSMLAVFVAEPAAAGLPLRRVFCSGEALPASLRDRFHDTFDAELHNLYGPTEAAVDVTWWDASRGDRSEPVPIGRPVWNTHMYVLDSRLRPLPAGVPGDLYIGGVQLAREYLGRADLTRERFVPDPFRAGARMYRTGDIARWREDGVLLFLGRVDHQVKIRGFRVELGEVETAIQASGAVAHAAAIAIQDGQGEPQIVAYLVPRGGEAVDVESVRTAVAARVPDYMVPGAFVTLRELPLTRSGKLDRAALPAPARQLERRGRALRSETERRVASLFAAVLGIAAGRHELRADDDFFALGGHSLSGARLMARVRREWGCDLGLGVVFAEPTVARLAGAIDADRTSRTRVLAADGFGPVIRLVAGDATLPPLFCVHPAGGIAWCYGALGRALTPRRDVYGLQASALDPSAAPAASLEEMASTYVDRVRAIQPSGPYQLAGWSVGGIIAHAMAVRLQTLGAEVRALVMLDAYPSDLWRTQADPGEDAGLRALLLVAGHDPAALDGAPLTRDSVITFLRRSGHALGELSDAALTGVMRVVDGNNRLVRRFHHQAFRGSLLYFRAALDHADDGLEPGQWAPYVSGRIEVHDVAAVHAHLTGPAAVAQIAPLLGRMLAKGR